MAKRTLGNSLKRWISFISQGPLVLLWTVDFLSKKIPWLCAQGIACQVPESMQKVDYSGLRRCLSKITKSCCELLHATAVPRSWHFTALPAPSCQLSSSSSHEVHEDPSPTKFPEHCSVDGGGAPKFPPSLEVLLFHGCWWRQSCSPLGTGQLVGRSCSSGWPHTCEQLSSSCTQGVTNNN